MALKREYEKMSAYGYGFFYGRAGLELDAPWGVEDKDYNYVVRGFMDGHEIYCMYGEEEGIPYDFNVPEDEDGKYVHIGVENK